MIRRKNEEKALKALGARIVSLRKKKGLSQLTLSYLSEVSKTYMSDLERGRRNPSFLILERVAAALEVNLSTLLEGVE